MLKNYFGEKTTYNIAFLLHYQAWLLIPSIFGLLLFVFQVLDYLDTGDLEHALDGRLNPPFGLLLVIWSSVYLESWRSFDDLISQIWDS